MGNGNLFFFFGEPKHVAQVGIKRWYTKKGTENTNNNKTAHVRVFRLLARWRELSIG